LILEDDNSSETGSRVDGTQLRVKRKPITWSFSELSSIEDDEVEQWIKRNNADHNYLLISKAPS